MMTAVLQILFKIFLFLACLIVVLLATMGAAFLAFIVKVAIRKVALKDDDKDD